MALCGKQNLGALVHFSLRSKLLVRAFNLLIAGVLLCLLALELGIIVLLHPQCCNAGGG